MIILRTLLWMFGVLGGCMLMYIVSLGIDIWAYWDLTGVYNEPYWGRVGTVATISILAVGGCWVDAKKMLRARRMRPKQEIKYDWD